MSVLVWSFVWDFLYHLMSSFVQQILLNWLSKHNQTTCQACLWFVPVEGWFFWGFSKSLPCQYASRLHYAQDFSQRKINSFTSAMVQAVFYGPHSFSTQGKESSPTFQKHLIQTHTLLPAGMLAQGKYFTRNCQRPCSLPLHQPQAFCLSIAPQRSSPREHHGADMECRHGVSTAAVTPGLHPVTCWQGDTGFL